MNDGKRQTILIVDDTMVNRSVLSDILSDEYDILEAHDGSEAIKLLRQREGAVSLMLLDIVMPNMDGFGVLHYLRRHRWNDDVPVIVISAETSPAYIRKGFELGVVDYVNRPFDPEVVSQRVRNTIALFAKQAALKDIIVDQVKEREKTSTLMVDILSTIVEFRNGESGLHVTRIRIITELLLEIMNRRFPEYGLVPSEIALMSNAAALHDIGKIAIPEEILNKPGRLTVEEFEIMKTHSAVGDEMLAGLHFGKDEKLVHYARQICRWHHERWDGNGYPDGLAGNEIPLAAQAVSLADVYDALVSERVYKKAFSHETALDMIKNGECGVFNPVLLQCFLEEADYLKDMVKLRSDRPSGLLNASKLSRELMERGGAGLSDRTVQLLEQERAKLKFVSDLSGDVFFDYDVESETIVYRGRSCERYGFPDTMLGRDWASLNAHALPFIVEFREKLEAASPADPIVNEACLLTLPDGEEHRCAVSCYTVWDDGAAGRMAGLIGRLAVED